MTDSAKQTALFFGFVTAAMTCASAQAMPLQPQPTGATAGQETMVQKTEIERKRAARIERELSARGPAR